MTVNKVTFKVLPDFFKGTRYVDCDFRALKLERIQLFDCDFDNCKFPILLQMLVDSCAFEQCSDLEFSMSIVQNTYFSDSPSPVFDKCRAAKNVLVNTGIRQ